MEITIDTLFDRYTEDSQLREANALPTVRSGVYRARCLKYDLRVDDREDTSTPGRQSARLFVELRDRQTDERRGALGFSVSWEPHYLETANGRRLDSPSRLWGQLVKALDAAGKSVGEILRDVLPNYPFDVFVDESFRMPDGTFKSYRLPRGFRGSDEEAQALLAAERRALVAEGGEPVNFVQSISKAKVQ